MLIREPDDIPSSEITPERVYINRREFIGKSAGIALGGAAGGALIGGGIGGALAGGPRHLSAQAPVGQRDWSTVRSEMDEVLTPYEDVTSYNNFYEFGTQKEDRSETHIRFSPDPGRSKWEDCAPIRACMAWRISSVPERWRIGFTGCGVWRLGPW